MTYDAGSAVAKYILDRSDVRAGEAEIRATFARIRQDATTLGRSSGPSLAAPDPQAAIGIQQYIETLRQVAPAVASAASPIQALIESIRAEGVALGQSDEQISAHLAALSREALAVGDVARALELEEAALGAEAAQQSEGTAKSLQRTQAEARAAVAARDYAGALRLLSGELASQGERTVGVINAERQLITVSNQAAAATEKAALVEQRQADTAIRVAQQHARAALATKDYAGALQILNVAQEENAGAGATALAGLETQIAQVEAAGTATGAFGAELGSLLSPLALATAGFGAAVGVVKSFGDALHFAGQLQEERTAFGGILGDFQLGNAILDEATKRTRAYGFTAKETTDAFRELAPVIRESTSTTKDQAEALARIAVLHPDDPVKSLTSAIEGIKTGRFRELSKELGLTTTEQQQLKSSTDQGKDAFIALNEVLDKHGITLQVAAERTDGLAGAERRQQQATEDLEKAQARFAAGPGLALLNQRIKVTNDATDAFGGSVLGLNNVIGDSVGTFNPLIGAITGYNNAVLGAGRGALVWAGILQNTATPAIQDNTRANQQAVAQGFAGAGAFNAYAAGANAAGIAVDQAAAKINFSAQAMALSSQASTVDTAAKAAQTAQTALVGAQTDKAASAFIQLNPTMGASAAFAAAVAQGLGVVTAQVIAFRIEANKAKGDLLGIQNAQRQTQLDQLIGLRRTEGASSGRGGGSDAQADATAFVGTLQKQNTEQQKLLDSEIGLASAKKNTAREIDLLRQKQSQYAKGTAEYNQIEAQIIGVQTAAGRTRVSAAASTGLQLQNVEENTQAQLLKTQREGLERLRDQEQDFDLKRSRSKEDEDEKIRGLLARGQRAEAAREEADFAKRQRRDAEDFNIQRQRTIRNNTESTGDITGSAARRTDQIDARAALRGVKPTGGGVGATPALPDLPAAASAAPSRAATLTIQGVINLDGKAIGTAAFPTIEVLMDESLAISLSQIGVPNAGQLGVGGVG